MLRPLWRGADRLIINGDTAEVHDHTCRAEAARQVLRIVELCEADGVELTLLPGNHDPMISDVRSLSLYDDAVFITHGDALHPAISPWNTNRAHLQELHEKTLAALDPITREQLEGQLDAAQFASHFKWEEMAAHPPRPQPRWRYAMDKGIKAALALWYWQTLPRAAARYARRYAPQSRFFIFGHIHRSGIWRSDERIIINTGSYDFPSKPRAVVIERGKLGVWPIVRGEQAFELASQPLATFDVTDRAAA